MLVSVEPFHHAKKYKKNQPLQLYDAFVVVVLVHIYSSVMLCVQTFLFYFLYCKLNNCSASECFVLAPLNLLHFIYDTVFLDSLALVNNWPN